MCSLQDALPLLMRRHRLGPGTPLDPAALTSAIRDATSVDVTEFFGRYIMGREPLPEHSPGE
jgi:hypothetical protein